MTFLQQTRQISPKMYVFFLIFLAGTFLSHLFRISSAPFFVYGMYAAPVPVTDFNSFLIVMEDGKTIYNKPEIWNHHKRIAVYYSARTRDQILQNPDFEKKNDEIHRIFPNENALKNEYGKWLHRYVEDLEGRDFKNISLYRVTVKYDGKGNFKPYKIEKIFTESKK